MIQIDDMPALIAQLRDFDALRKGDSPKNALNNSGLALNCKGRKGDFAMIEMVIALAIVGAVAGVIAGLFGVGGGMILVPAFYYAFTTLGYAHQDLMQICLATSLATIVVTSLRSLSAHNKRGGVDWDVLRTWAPGIMIGALVSVAFAAQLRSQRCNGFLAVGDVHWALYGLWQNRMARCG